MKIIIATPIYPPEVGGPATYTKELAELLHTKHEVTIVALTNNQEAVTGTTLVAVAKNTGMLKRLWSFFLAVNKEAKTADVIYAQNAMAAGLPSVLAGKLRRKPVIIKFVGDEAWERATQHKKTTKQLEDFLENPDGGMKISLMRFIQGWTLRQASIVTTPSEYLGEAIAKSYSIKLNRVKTNYNAIGKTTEAPFDAEMKPHQVLITARLTKWKGIDGVIHAIKIVRGSYPDVSLLVHGDGPSREELETLAESEGVSDIVTFTGNVSRSETWQSRKESEVYVLNSTYEGLPHTILTSFQAQIPVVATNIPGTNEAVYHEKSGLLVESNNPQELAIAIMRLFEDKTLCTQLIAGGNELLEKKFSWSQHLATLESFFESVILKPRN